MIEQDVRYQIDQSLKSNGWILNAVDLGRNVYFEDSVKQRLSQASAQSLGQKRPDYTLFNGTSPLAIIEAKKPSVTNLGDALRQAQDYAQRIGVEIIFACNGTTIKSQYLGNNKPLYLNGAELTEFPRLSLLSRFHDESSNEVFTVPKEIIKSRTELIKLFAELNDDLRAEGLRAGIERFSEFANILFLKLLSEKGDDEIWQNLLRLSENHLLPYLNDVAMKRLRDNYGGDVITRTAIQTPSTMKRIVNTLNPLQLTDIDEDIKGVAFEHFIQKTTDTQNDLGEYFTPRHIVRFLVRLLNPQFGESIYDPFCGTGGFLTETFRHIKQQCNISKDNTERLYNETVFGGEITTTARIAKMNMILFGDGHSGVKQQNSLQANTDGQYDNVLSNIPFSQTISRDVLDLVSVNAKDADEACALKCFNSLKAGGSLAIVVPEGLLVNRNRQEFWRHILQRSRVRMLVRLPRGCFAPYTEAKTGILYLTDKEAGKTDWFYRITVKDDGYDNKRIPIHGINDLDRILFFDYDSPDPQNSLHSGLDVDVVYVRNLENENSFLLDAPWKISNKFKYVKLEKVASLQNGKSITKKDTIEGDIPVIAGGRGTIAYHHGRSNHQGRVFTVSKSGAYSGYVWWHDDPIWASDSIVIWSKDESKYLSRYLYMCMALKQEEIYERQQGTGQPHIYISHIKDFPVPDIPIDDQTAMLSDYELAQSVLRQVEKRITKHEDKIQQNIMSYYEDRETTATA